MLKCAKCEKELHRNDHFVTAYLRDTRGNKVDFCLCEDCGAALLKDFLGIKKSGGGVQKMKEEKEETDG